MAEVPSMTTKTAMVRKNQLKSVSTIDAGCDSSENLHSEEDKDGNDTQGAGEAE